MHRQLASLALCLWLGLTSGIHAADGPVARWKLTADGQDSVGKSHGVAQDVEFTTGQSAKFNGRSSQVTIPATESLKLGTGDFTISLWVDTAEILDDDLGDLISQFDSESRTGFHLSLRNNTGVTSSLANYRQLEFGIDAGTEPVFTDEGRPGNAVFGQSMAVHDGKLYVGTCEAGKDQAGHVFRFDGPGQWTDCGSPDKANSITAIADTPDGLFVGSGKYRLGGSSLAESENPHFGGRIFKYLGEKTWEEVGHFPAMEAVGGMTYYKGKLYIGSLYKPAAFQRYDGDKTWTEMPVPNGKRVESLGVFNGYLWATGYDEGHVYRFDGEQWTDLGRAGDEETTQTYAFATYKGMLQVATWRAAKVYAWERQSPPSATAGPVDAIDGLWQNRGRLGEELEVMGMLIHNGSFYAGTLPLAQIYRYDGGETWTLLKQLDTTPDVKYRRLWTMAEYQGKLFSTTLPSGHIWSMQTGACVTTDKQFPPGRHHIAAQREKDTLRLYVDGQLAAESKAGQASSLDLTNDQPWRIGAGSGDSFNGKLNDVQVFRRALSIPEIRALAKGE